MQGVSVPTPLCGCHCCALLAPAGDAWARKPLDDGRIGKVFSCPGFKFAAAHMFDLLGDNGDPPQKLALQPAQLAFLLMWVSASASHVMAAQVRRQQHSHRQARGARFAML